MTLSDEQAISRFDVDANGCWIWRLRPNSDGYGQIVRRKKHFYAHVFSYLFHVGPVPEGLELDHICSVRLCINPAHLEPVTHAENVDRGRSKTHMAERTHCVNGHELSGSNVHMQHWTRKDGTIGMFRRCRKCAAEVSRREREARRAA